MLKFKENIELKINITIPTSIDFTTLNECNPCLYHSISDKLSHVSQKSTYLAPLAR